MPNQLQINIYLRQKYNLNKILILEKNIITIYLVWDKKLQQYTWHPTTGEQINSAEIQS
jgi:hypothetical protein